MQTPNDNLSPALQSALIGFYKLAFADEEAAARGQPLSCDATRRIAFARGIDLANAAPEHLREKMMQLAYDRTCISRGVDCGRR